MTGEYWDVTLKQPFGTRIKKLIVHVEQKECTVVYTVRWWWLPAHWLAYARESLRRGLHVHMRIVEGSRVMLGEESCYGTQKSEQVH